MLNTNTLPQSSISNQAADIEINSDGDIIASMGFGKVNWISDGIYISETGNVGEWTKLNDGSNIFPTTQSGIKRIEIAVAPSDANIIYALVEDDSLVTRPGIIESTLNRYKTLTSEELEFIESTSEELYGQVLNLAIRF